MLLEKYIIDNHLITPFFWKVCVYSLLIFNWLLNYYGRSTFLEKDKEMTIIEHFLKGM
ncbi:unnamed protein product [Schistosoma margrebowiei]|uniref:Uncharacterized protein n=1 Tax=Schistosoma margrebowiei TaxID=48269 RepID=A0A183MI14_9TREM|nr:unnamed protein product [Schistosoma margrebowiei]